jgi:hypothetical protein
MIREKSGKLLSPRTGPGTCGQRADESGDTRV